MCLICILKWKLICYVSTSCGSSDPDHCTTYICPIELATKLNVYLRNVNETIKSFTAKTKCTYAYAPHEHSFKCRS